MEVGRIGYSSKQVKTSEATKRKPIRSLSFIDETERRTTDRVEQLSVLDRCSYGADVKHVV